MTRRVRTENNEAKTHSFLEEEKRIAFKPKSGPPCGKGPRAATDLADFLSKESAGVRQHPQNLPRALRVGYRQAGAAATLFASGSLLVGQQACVHQPLRSIANNVLQALPSASYISNQTSVDLVTTAQRALLGVGEPQPSVMSTGGALPIPMLGVLVAAVPLVAVAAMSFHLRLGLNSKLAVGAARCVAQLSAVGFVLGPVFLANRWWITVPYAFVMCTVAAIEATSRPRVGYPGMLLQTMMAIGLASSSLIVFGLTTVIHSQPWYDAKYLIPMQGMLLGSSCSSVAVGLTSVLDDLSAGRDKVEALLAMGASRVEATNDVVRRSLRLALTPLLNSLNVVGIVSIPGMMTGQILGGSDPVVAARYQIVTFFLIAASTAMSAVAGVYAAVFTVCGPQHSVLMDRMVPQTGPRGAVARIGALAGTVGTRAWATLSALRTPSTQQFTRLGEEPPDDLEQAHGARGASAAAIELIGPLPGTRQELQGSRAGEGRAHQTDRIAALQAPSPVAQRGDSSEVTFAVEHLVRSIGERVLHNDVGFTVRSGEALFLRGPSGVGKTQLLRSLAGLDAIDSGALLLDGHTPNELGYPNWRAMVGYVFQQRIAFEGTPSELYTTAQAFRSQRNRPHRDLPTLVREVGLEDSILEQPWTQLSGGQAQRLQLLIMVALAPAVLLLDEPTASLDLESALRVERVLKASGAALIWVTHDLAQPARVGGRVLDLPSGVVFDLPASSTATDTVLAPT